MAASFERHERGGSVLYGAAGGIWLMLIFARPTKPDMLLARPSLSSMARRERAGFPTLTWVLPEAGFALDEDARTAATDVTNEFKQSVNARATLIEGTGFQSAAVRAIVAGIDLLSRSAAPTKVFSELGAAVEWCTARRARAAGPASPVEEVVRALVLARESIARPA